ncbi:hypothetical protein Tco_0109535 [Tanacetum coccineum]
MVMKKDFKIIKGKRDKFKSIALKVKMESSNDKESTSGIEDEEYAMAVSDFKKFFKRGGKFESVRSNQGTRTKKGFVSGTWIDNGEEDEELKKDAVCLMAQESNEETVVYGNQSKLFEDESIDNGFARFNNMNTIQQYEHFLFNNMSTFLSLKMRALIMDLLGLSLDELIDNIKAYEMVIMKDFKIIKGKRDKFKSIALKVKMKSSNDKESTSRSEDEEYAMAKRNDKKGKNDRKYFRCIDPNHIIGECPKQQRNKNQKGFVSGTLIDNGEEEEELKKDAVYLMAQESNEITILKTNTPYPSRKTRRIRACTHQRPQRNKDQYAVSRGLNTPYSRYGINIIFWKISSVVPTLRNPQYAVSNSWIRRIIKRKLENEF